MEPFPFLEPLPGDPLSYGGTLSPVVLAAFSSQTPELRLLETQVKLADHHAGDGQVTGQEEPSLSLCCQPPMRRRAPHRDVTTAVRCPVGHVLTGVWRPCVHWLPRILSRGGQFSAGWTRDVRLGVFPAHVIWHVGALWLAPA